MKNRFVGVFSIMLFLLVVNGSYASTSSELLVREGRSLLFNNGTPTLTGVVAANDKFKLALQDDSSDEEANLFYALSRIITSPLVEGDGVNIETMLDLLESFGVYRNNDNTPGAQPFTEPPELYGLYNPPMSVPTGAELQTYFSGPFLTLLDAAIANLAVLNDSFTTLLTPAETGDLQNIEIDYGDILLLRSMIYTIKTEILMMTAWDLGIDLRKIFVLGNADILEIQRDLLDQSETFLKLNPAGSTSMTSAKVALNLAIDNSREAFTSITSETDPQYDDLFSFSSQQDIDDAINFFFNIDEVQESLDQNRSALLFTGKTWILTHSTGERLMLELEEDVTGNFSSGYVNNLDGGGQYFFSGGTITNFSVTNTAVSISISPYGYCPGSATFTGTLADDQITNGSYAITDCNGSRSGSFTGDLVDVDTSEGEIDFNYLFGNTGKSALDLRDALPTFTPAGEIIAGTFPSPILGGLFPQITTEKDLISITGLSVVHPLPVVTDDSIVIDGASSDWSGISSVSDDHDDPYDYNTPPVNGNINSLYVARDSNFLYWMLDLTDPPVGNNISFSSQFKRGDSNLPTSYLTSHGSYDSSGSNIYQLYSMDANWQEISHSNDPSDIGFGEVVEVKIPLDLFTGWESLVTVFANVNDGLGGWDSTPKATIQLPTATLSGMLTCPNCTGPGQIFIKAYNGPSPNSSQLIGSTILSGPGAYSISGLPIGQTVYLFAHADSDDNGIETFGDFLGNAGPVTTQIGENLLNISDMQLIDDSFIKTKPGVYRIFGSNTFTPPANYSGPWDPNQIDWGTGWTFLGEASNTSTFSTSQFYKIIIMIWHDGDTFLIDSFEDSTAGTAFTINTDNTIDTYNWISSGIRNVGTTSYYEEPSNFKGRMDNQFVYSSGNGFSLFTMPDDTLAFDSARELKVTAYISTEDSDGDSIVDFSDLCPNTPSGEAVDLNGCSTSQGSMYLQYKTISDTVTFEATDFIYVGDNVTSALPNGPVIFAPDSNATLRSHAILFRPGVHVQSGSTLHVIAQ